MSDWMDDDNLDPGDEYIEISSSERWVYNQARGAYQIFYEAGVNDFRSFSYTEKMGRLK